MWTAPAAEGRIGGRRPALSSEKVEAVRCFLGNGGSVSAAARTFGVSRPTVRAVRDGTCAGPTRHNLGWRLPYRLWVPHSVEPMANPNFNHGLGRRETIWRLTCTYWRPFYIKKKDLP